MVNQQTLIIGANSDIAKAIARQLFTNPHNAVTLISRDLTAYDDVERPLLTRITVPDYQAENIERAVERVYIESQTPITQVFICHGVLHNKKTQPEKRIEDFSAEAFYEVMSANALTPLLWIQKLTPFLKGGNVCKVVVFSARVGSISDNQLGGWYSYRASKAALNMMLKTVAIELARRAKNVKVIAFHPGTTDTPLSKPFQKSVPAHKLFTSEFVASQLLSIVENTDADGVASYLDWQGKSIEW